MTIAWMHITSACTRTGKPLRSLSAGDAKRYVALEIGV